MGQQYFSEGYEVSSRYSMLAPIGEGGMGAVYLAIDKILERKVAIKVLHLSISEDSHYLARFEREAKIVAQLSTNPHIVSIYDYGLLETGAPFLVMEYLTGRNLRSLIKEYKTPSRTFVIDIGIQTAYALWDAHSQGVIHRDLKPENIFYLEVPTIPLLVKVLDFGIARSESLALSSELATTPGGIIGTPAYIAPEQALGKPVSQSDIFALGVLLYEFATGYLPYESDTALGHIMQHINSDPKPFPNYQNTPGQWPQSFSELVMSMLNRNPQQRPSAREVLVQLTKIDDQIEQEKRRLR
jgi:eukaryotic-like serine/threonine-protein kinase